jgi:hypothetical protein
MVKHSKRLRARFEPTSEDEAQYRKEILNRIQKPEPADSPSALDEEQIGHSAGAIQIGTDYCPTCGKLVPLMAERAQLRAITQERLKGLSNTKEDQKGDPGGKFRLADDGLTTVRFVDCPNCRQPEGTLSEMHVWLLGTEDADCKRTIDARANLVQDPAQEVIRSALIEQFGGYDADALGRLVAHLCISRGWTRDQVLVSRRTVVAEILRGEKRATTPDDGEQKWSRPRSPKDWREIFHCSQTTLRERFAKQVIRNRKLGGKSYQVDVSDLPVGCPP